jgi:hypothetical protein
MGTIEVAPTFWRVVTPQGIALICADPTPWPDHIGITDDLLNLADPAYVTHGDGMVRFTPDLGTTALYGYAHPDGPGVNHYDLLNTGRPIPKEGD